MNAKRLFGLVSVLLLGLAVGLPPAHADAYNELTYLTFNRPIRISSPSGPMVLPAGTYEFKLLGSSNRNIMQIFDADGRLVTDVVTTTTEYLAPSIDNLVDRTMLTFAEGSKNQPPTLVKWFYPDNNFGHELVYSHRVERQLSEDRMITVEARPGQLKETSRGVTMETQAGRPLNGLQVASS